MEYLKGISLKAIAIGFVGGYCVPYVLLKLLAYLLVALKIEQLFGLIPLVVVILIVLVAPLASGYLGAKYSNTLPLLNGVLASAVGLAAFGVIGQMGSVVIYLIVITLAISLSYVGAKRYVAHG